MYMKGWGVPRDAQQASHWFRKAARQGYADAQQALEKLSSRKHLVQ
jgi:TPR repeat protein